MMKNDTITQLADKDLNDDLRGCDIIICATRTGGMTVKKIDEVAEKYDYNTIWMSSLYSPSLNCTVLNRRAAQSIVEIIKSLIVGQF